MTELTLAVRNARIVDGLGAPARLGDIGVVGDRIVSVGEAPGRAQREIDAGGRVAAPGFIDIHTHYDPQLCWDGAATPSPEHGVTTIVAGNCSLSLAPVRPEHRSKITALFGVVEDLEAAYFDAAVPYAWESFAEYLAHIRDGLGPNVGMLVGHAALRLYVMGAEAQKRQADAAELAELCAVFREALRAGALGLSLTYGHMDEVSQELPTFFADDRELLALCRVMAEEGRGVLECAPDFRSRRAALALIDRLGRLSQETGVTCSMSPILHAPHVGDLWLRQLVKLEAWRAQGVRLFAQTQTRPLDQTVRLSRGSVILTKYPGWNAIMNLPLEARRAAFADTRRWEALEAEIARSGKLFDSFVVRQSPAAPDLDGRRVRDIAEARGRTFTETLLSIALADGLETDFEIKDFIHADPEVVSLLLSHPAVQIGSADAGAHVGQFSGAGDTCFLLQRFVRELGYLSLEHAVQKLTSNLAAAWGIQDRGELTPGKFADLVIFDPETIARGEEVWADDLPGGGGRYVRHAVGVEQVIVNGEVLVEGGRYTAARPGRIV